MSGFIVSADNSPMVSIVMITYNQEKEIDEAIKGVIKQKVSFPIELIISDDCSTDSTYNLITKWASRYPSIIKVIHNEKNIGIQGNYLRALSHCTGKYVAMCDGDDYWISSKKISRQVEYMEKHPECSITFHRMINYYSNSGEMSLSNGGQKSDSDILDLSKGNFITNASVMYRVGDIDLKNLPDFLKENTLLDYSLHMIFASHGSIHYFNRPMGVYRKLSVAAWSTKADFAGLKLAYAVRKSLINFFKKEPEVIENLKNASKQILSKLYQTSGQQDDLRNWAIAEWNQINDNPSHKINSYYETTPQRVSKKITTRLRKAITKCLPRPRP